MTFACYPTPRALPLALAALVAAACARRTGDGLGPADGFATETPSPGDSSPADAPSREVLPEPDAPTEGPLDGTWDVIGVACNGVPANEAILRFVTAPNRSSFFVVAARSAYTLMTPSCSVGLFSSIAYPSPGRAVFTATGPFVCSPRGCGAGCDTVPAEPYVYDYTRDGASLTMRTVGSTPDVTCTANGQENPITYTYRRRR